MGIIMKKTMTGNEKMTIVPRKAAAFNEETAKNSFAEKQERSAPVRKSVGQ